MSLINGQQATYSDIKQGLQDCGGISRIAMWQLREANGNTRLGTNVTNEIGQKLRRKGIGYINQLGLGQYDEVRLYLISSPIGSIIEALDDLSPAADQILADASSCQSKLEMVREVVEVV